MSLNKNNNKKLSNILMICPVCGSVYVDNTQCTSCGHVLVVLKEWLKRQ